MNDTEWRDMWCDYIGIFVNNCYLCYGDCYEILPRLNLAADAIITDPPYGNTDCSFDGKINLEQLWKECGRITKPTANFVLFGCGKFSVDLINSNRKWYRYDLVWQKNNKVGFLNAGIMPLRQHEQILIFGRPGNQKRATYNPIKTFNEKGITKKKTHSFGECYRDRNSDYYNKVRQYDGWQHPTSVLSFDTDRNKISSWHPTTKPLKLMEYLVQTYTNKGDIVIDPFMGSGTTALACMKHQRRFMGIEREEKYYNMAVNRILDYESNGL